MIMFVCSTEIMDICLYLKQYKQELVHFHGVNKILIFKGDLVEKDYLEYYEKICIRKLNYTKKNTPDV